MPSSDNTQRSLAAYAQAALVAMTASGTILLVICLLKYSSYGIDFSDEGLYLVWISNPFIYDYSLSQFGFIYHPLYRLVGGDISALRQANILITFGLAWALSYTFLISLAPESKGEPVILHIAAAGFATGALTLFNPWVSTPSYNSLTLQSLLVAGIGLLLAEKSGSLRSGVGAVLIGAGGWLAFMAKPSTALALAAGVFLYLLASRKLSIRLLALAVASALALLLVSAFLIDGSPLQFVERLRLAVELGRFIDAGHTLDKILRIDDFHLDGRFKIVIACLSIALVVAVSSVWAKGRIWMVAGLPISVALFAVTAWLTLGEVDWVAGLGPFEGLLIFGLVYAAALAGLILGQVKTLNDITVSQWAAALFFLAVPHIYAFGTNRNYWQSGSAASIFWLLAGLTLLGPLARERASWLLALPLALAAQAVTATLLQTGLEQPYRQAQPLRLNTSVLEIGPQKSALVLSQGFADYIASAAEAAREAGFQTASPVIDLTGQSPMILYALGAESIGQAWTIGGYPGSLDLAEAALGRTSCDKIAMAWVLFEQDGPRSIPTELMAHLGADFPNGYKQVGTWQTAAGAGGYAKRRTQQFYRPIRPQETLTACQGLRAQVAG